MMGGVNSLTFRLFWDGGIFGRRLILTTFESMEIWQCSDKNLDKWKLEEKYNLEDVYLFQNDKGQGNETNIIRAMWHEREFYVVVKEDHVFRCPVADDWRILNLIVSFVFLKVEV
jgi:hypothetical protein